MCVCVCVHACVCILPQDPILYPTHNTMICLNFLLWLASQVWQVSSLHEAGGSQAGTPVLLHLRLHLQPATEWQHQALQGAQVSAGRVWDPPLDHRCKGKGQLFVECVVCVCVHVFSVHGCVCVCICVLCVWLCVCKCVHMCVCVCVLIMCK